MDYSNFMALNAVRRVNVIAGYGKFIPMQNDADYFGVNYIVRETDLTHVSLAETEPGIAPTILNMRALLNHFSRIQSLPSVIKHWLNSSINIEEEMHPTKNFHIWMCDVLNKIVSPTDLEDILYCRVVRDIKSIQIIAPLKTKPFSCLDLATQFDRLVPPKLRTTYEYGVTYNTFTISRVLENSLNSFEMRFNDDGIYVGCDINGKRGVEKLPLRFNYSDWKPQRWEKFMMNFTNLEEDKYLNMANKSNRDVYEIADEMKKDICS